MNQVINHIKLKPEIKIQPIVNGDAILKEDADFSDKSFFAKVFESIFEKSDFNFEDWQRIESKPRLNPSSEYSKYLYGGGLK